MSALLASVITHKWLSTRPSISLPSMFSRFLSKNTICVSRSFASPAFPGTRVSMSENQTHGQFFTAVIYKVVDPASTVVAGYARDVRLWQINVEISPHFYGAAGRKGGENKAATRFVRLTDHHLIDRLVVVALCAEDELEVASVNHLRTESYTPFFRSICEQYIGTMSVREYNTAEAFDDFPVMSTINAWLPRAN